MMKVAELQKKQEILIREKSVPEPSDYEVLIKVMSVGICGSDLHYFQHGRIGKRYVEKPYVQGHECSGIVVKVGKKISELKVGDKVAVEPGVCCGKCDYCKKGKYNLCLQVKFLSTPHNDGCFSEYITHPEEFTHKIPDNLSFDIATLVEPLSVGIHTANRLGLKPDETVLISGMGPVGILMVVVAKAFGVKKIIVTDLEPFRLKTARKLGAWKTYNILKDDINLSIDIDNEINKIDTVIDTSGNAKAIELGIDLLKRGGKLAAVGFPQEDFIPINLTVMLQKEIDLCGIYRYANTYQFGIDILCKEKNIQDLITDQFSLVDIKAGYNKLLTDKSKSIKIVIHPWD